ncbi:hypothetical protein SDC9_157529 [bioreactor metagenome]|uniref:Uncharacterized protein n=1 Tax=bioreactor metagenome TaxID=1076179 RepID=A0A645FCE1_9ZZZZ
MCDRLLLFGFLNQQDSFNALDVEEVAREIFEETIGGETQISPQTNLTSPSSTNVQFVNNAPLESGMSAALPPEQLLAVLNAEHVAERLARLEQSLLQLERINSATLNLMERLLHSGNLSADNLKVKENVET